MRNRPAIRTTHDARIYRHLPNGHCSVRLAHFIPPQPTADGGQGRWGNTGSVARR